MNSKKYIGHIATLITVFIWGTTFISTKLPLNSFKPVEILFLRFCIGFIVLVVAYPKRMKKTTVKQELTFAATGFCGITLYYLLENIALTYTTASNVGVIISIAPFFTAVLSCFFLKNTEKLSAGFYIGFIISIAGIFLISFGGTKFEFKPTGDLLSVAAAAVWAIYSVLTKKISSFGMNNVQTTRRVFAYGILFMLPFLFIFGCSFTFSDLLYLNCVMHILYLGLGASALCFVTWNFAVHKLGAVKTSAYIYLVPVITVVAAFLILKEQQTTSSVAGIVLTMFGLVLSEIKIKRKRGKNNAN